MRTKHSGILFIVIVGLTILSLLVLSVVLINGNERLQRSWKTMTSTYGGGLSRTVSVYSYDGKLIQKWIGKFDIERTESGVLFDIEGKRVGIQGGIIIHEEN